jgi:hypothetical protein
LFSHFLWSMFSLVTLVYTFVLYKNDVLNFLLLQG